MCEVSLLHVKRKWNYCGERVQSLKSHYDLDLWTLKSIEVLLGSRSTHGFSIITLCQKVCYHAETMQTSKYKFDLDLLPFDLKFFSGHAKYEVIIAYTIVTVNVVIFAGGKFRQNVGKAFHVGVIFTMLLLFPS